VNPGKLKILVTGVSGLLGSNLAYYFRDRHEMIGIYHSNHVEISRVTTVKGDITKPDEMQWVVSKFQPDVVIHCASLTNIDYCETHRAAAHRINVEGTRNLVQSLRESTAKLIYISTDAVFDGLKGNYSETDSVSPPNYYGQTKYEGELEAQQREKSLIVRTNIFGWNIRNKYSLAEWILYELMAEREIPGFVDVSFSSIYNFDLAQLLEQAISMDLDGMYNIASGSSLTKYEFAIAIAERFGLNVNLVKPISVHQFPLIAKRAKNLSLDVEKIRRTLQCPIPSIQQSIDNFQRDFLRGLHREIRTEIHPSPARLPFLPYGRQAIDDEDIQAVVQVLKSTNLTQGPCVSAFEESLCRTVDARYAIACNSGTSALHMACLSVGIKPGDEVITSPITFVASANCVLYCGAIAVFADIATDTYNVSPTEIEKRISERTRAVIPVHYAGQSCDMEAIQDIVRRAEKRFGRKIYIIEDACHALGSLYKERKVGSCAFSDMTVMSFHPVKHITTGEGGVVLTNDGELQKRLRLLRSHGITSSAEDFQNLAMAFQEGGPAGEKLLNPWYYEQVDLGFNYRITDIQCALGLSQLRKLESYRRRRREIVALYNRSFENHGRIKIPFEDPRCKSNFHLYVLLLDFEAIGMSRARFMSRLRERGIQAQVHYIPVHLQPYYRQALHTGWGDCPESESFYRKCLSIPLHPAMTDQDVNHVINQITNLVGA